MADPVGIVGTAAGIVSLGLQLYGGITTYCDALEGREDDLASARAQLDSLRDSLVTIQSALPPSASATASTGSSTVPPIVRECEKELNQLDTLLQELAGSSSSSKKLKDRVKTLRFPFRRDNLMRLEDRLHKTNAVFQTALSVFHLNKSLGNEQKLANVEAATAQIPAINATVVDTNTDVQEIKAGVGQISNDMNTAMSTLHSSNSAVLNLANGFATFAPAANAQLGEIRLGMGALAQGDDIRQLTSIAVNNANMLATMERRMQTLSVLEERLGLLADSDQFIRTDSIQAQDPRIALQRLLAKPSQTREILDSLGPLRSTTRIRDSSFQKASELSLGPKFQGPSCTCLRRKVRQGTSRSFGPFWLRTETSYDGHSQNCRIAKLQLGKQRRWFELTTARKYSFWSWAVAVSLAINTGAGGLSISPSINYRPVVDEERSPVFRVLNALEMLLQWRPGNIFSFSELPRCLGAVASTILTLYQEKKAFPHEVNTRGESAVYKMVLMLSSDYDWYETLCDFIMWAVKDADLPANICDFSGRTPVMEFALKTSVAIHEHTQLLSILFDKAPESVINCDMLNNGNFRYGYWLNGGGFIVRQVSSNFNLAHIQHEIFDYGPVCTAISADRRVEQINDLVNAMDTSEVTSFGQTPLHLAVGTDSLDVLAALLRSSHMLDILHLRDIQGSHVIDYAVRDSGWCDDCRDLVSCAECYCSGALDVLLCVEGCFDGYLESSIDPRKFSSTLCKGSFRSSFLLLSELKRKRDPIKHLALAHLDDKDIQHYNLDRDDVLDFHGIDVVERLNGRGIKVPTTLTNAFFKSSRRRSIYHDLSSQGLENHNSKHLVQQVFDLGFHDTNERDDLGYTPLMLSCHQYAHPVVVFWFVEHGADLTSKYPCTGSWRNHVMPTVAQQAFARLREFMPLPDYQDCQRTLITSVVPVDNTVDDCKCYCTEDGCSSASILFWGLWEACKVGRRYTLEPSKTPTEVGEEIAMLLERYSLDLTSYHHACLAALRMLTFEALGISHTCGCQDSWNKPQLSSDEIQQMWEEEAHLIERLEELQTEFEIRFDESGTIFSTFLTTHWVPRLKDVLRELDGYKLSEAERTCAEALGVKWQDREEDEHGGGSNAIESVENFFRVLREIEKE